MLVDFVDVVLLLWVELGGGGGEIINGTIECPMYQIILFFLLLFFFFFKR